MKPPRGKRVGPFTAIAGGLSPVLLLALKAVCGRRSSAPPFGETDVLLLRSRRRRRGSGRGRRSGGRGGCFCRCRFFLLPLPRSPEPSFYAWHQHVASASARRGGVFGHPPKPHGRHRTHFPSGPSSRPVLGVQVDARCPAGGRRSQTLAAFVVKGRLPPGPRPYCPFLPGTEEP